MSRSCNAWRCFGTFLTTTRKSPARASSARRAAGWQHRGADLWQLGPCLPFEETLLSWILSLQLRSCCRETEKSPLLHAGRAFGSGSLQEQLSAAAEGETATLGCAGWMHGVYFPSGTDPEPAAQDGAGAALGAAGTDWRCWVSVAETCSCKRWRRKPARPPAGRGLRLCPLEKKCGSSQPCWARGWWPGAAGDTGSGVARVLCVQRGRAPLSPGFVWP